jgi:hypothetical protein
MVQVKQGFISNLMITINLHIVLYPSYDHILSIPLDTQYSNLDTQYTVNLLIHIPLNLMATYSLSWNL